MSWEIHFWSGRLLDYQNRTFRACICDYISLETKEPWFCIINPTFSNVVGFLLARNYIGIFRNWCSSLFRIQLVRCWKCISFASHEVVKWCQTAVTYLLGKWIFLLQRNKTTHNNCKPQEFSAITHDLQRAQKNSDQHTVVPERWNNNKGKHSTNRSIAK